MYQDHTLKSGRVVGMRPLTWDEYWDIQKTHLMGLKDLQEKGEAVTDAEFRLELMLAHKDFREKPLALCVNDWDAIKSELLMPEVVELEKTLQQISQITILSGNSEPAAVAVPVAGPNTAATA